MTTAPSAKRVSLRSNQVSGAITMLFGLLMVLFGMMSLGIVALQRLALSAVSTPAPVEFLRLMDAVHGVFVVYLPFTIAGGVVFAVSGWFVCRGSQTARRIAQANALLGYVWVIAYGISCYWIMPLAWNNPAMPLPQEVAQPLALFNTLVGSVLVGAFPTLLLFLLSRPGPDDLASSQR